MRFVRGRLSDKAVAIGIIYFLVSCIWIVSTDKLVAYFKMSREATIAFAITKGILFLAITALLLVLLLRQLHRANATLNRLVIERTAELAESKSHLQKSSERLQNLLSNLPAITWTAAEDGVTSYMSDNVEGVLGFTAAEMCSASPKFWFGNIHPDDSARVSEDFQALFSTGKPFDLEYQVRRKDGHWIWIHDRALRTHEEHGMRYADGMFLEITEQKEMERSHEKALAELRKSELHYRLLVEQASDGIFVADSNCRYIDVNSAGAKMLGYSREEVVGLSIADVIMEQEVPRIPEETGRLSESDVLVSEWKFRRKDGSWFIGEVAGRRLPDGRLQGIVRDVTSRQRAEHELRENKRWLDAAMEAAKIAVWSYDLTTGEWVTNALGSELLGVPQRAEISIGNLLNRVLPEDRTAIENKFQQQMPDLEIALDFRLASLYGIRWMHAQGRTLQDNSGRPVGTSGVLVDITDRKLAEEQLLLLQQELQQAQKMEAVGQLAGGVAHDFNNLLHVVMAYAELAGLQVPTRSAANRHLKMILEAAKRASDVTGQLLAFGRKQILNPRVFCINESVMNTSKMLGRLIGEDIVLTTDLDSNLASTKADPGQVEQIIMNLAVNARDAMPRGGKLTITTRTVPLQECPSAIPAGDYVRLSVQDSGSGMTEEVKSRIFEPFFTTKEKGKGTGLGLATVYGIVRQSEGYIECTSRVGEGTQFDVYFPAVPHLPDAFDADDTGTEIGAHDETVLLVEDDEAVRESAKEMLESLGFRVLVSQNGSEAMQIARVHEGPIHLVLTDVVMPGMSGSHLAAELHKQRPEAKFVFMSGYTDDAMLRQGIIQSAVPFLQKPFTLRSIAKKLDEVLKEPSQFIPIA